MKCECVCTCSHMCLGILLHFSGLGCRRKSHIGPSHNTRVYHFSEFLCEFMRMFIGRYKLYFSFHELTVQHPKRSFIQPS